MGNLDEVFHFSMAVTLDLFWTDKGRPLQSSGSLQAMVGNFTQLRGFVSSAPPLNTPVKFHVRLGAVLLESGTGSVSQSHSDELEIRVLSAQPLEDSAIAVRLTPFLALADRARYLAQFGGLIGGSHSWVSWASTCVRLSHLVEISARINSSETLERLLAEIMEAAKEIMGAEASSLMLLDRESGDLVIAVPTGPAQAEISGLRIPAGKGFAGWVVANGTPLIVPDAEQDPRFFGEVSKAGFRTRNLICVPMHDAEGQIIGVLQALNRIGTVGFTEDDLPIFSALSDQASIAIERARLHREALEKQRLDREISLARSIQLGFLPKEMPEYSGFQFAGYSEPAAQVGGDYFDVIPLDGKTCALVVADISGKGFSAALLMASLRAMLRNQIRHRARVDETIALLNNGFVDDSPLNRFVTVFYGELDSSTGILTYVNAGHNPPFLFKRGAVSMLTEGGPIVGFRKDLAFDSGSVQLVEGDSLVMFTDGVVEAQNAAEEMFGDDRLCRTVSRIADSGGDASQILASIRQSVSQFVGNARQYDDLTLLVVSVKVR
jgi:sigma-B regulation protein RsbU (phosphoserine phosphatase)